MAGELTQILFHRVKKTTSNSNIDEQTKVKVRNNISALLDKHLVQSDDVLEFYVHPRYLGYALEALDDPLIIERYDIDQVDENVFRAAPREIIL